MKFPWSDALRDQIPDILLHLPVKSLLRFRCVSTEWKYIIDGRRFISDHLSHSRSSATSLLIQTFEPTTNKPLPLLDWVVGSCDGLLCCLDKDLAVVLRNPSTRTFKRLHFTQWVSAPDETVFVSLGFGRGLTTRGNYKVVMLNATCESGDILTYKFKVYSLGDTSWRTIDETPRYGRYEPSCFIEAAGVLVNGALHWLVWRRKEEIDSLYYNGAKGCILAFDLETEQFHELELPLFRITRDVPGRNYRVLEIILRELDRCLCVACYFTTDMQTPSQEHVAYWVLIDYAVEDSWSKVASVGHEEILQLKPLVYSRDFRKILFARDSSLVWYNLESQEFEDSPSFRSGDLRLLDVNPIVDSLVAIDGAIRNCEMQGTVMRRLRYY